MIGLKQVGCGGWGVLSLVIIFGFCLPYFIQWMLHECLLCARYCSRCGNGGVNRTGGPGWWGGGPSLRELSFPSNSFTHVHFTVDIKEPLVWVLGFHMLGKIQ